MRLLICINLVMLEEKENSDGSLTIILTENGKRKALTYQIDEMKIKKLKNGIKMENCAF